MGKLERHGGRQDCSTAMMDSCPEAVLNVPRPLGWSNGDHNSSHIEEMIRHSTSVSINPPASMSKTDLVNQQHMMRGPHAHRSGCVGTWTRGIQHR